MRKAGFIAASIGTAVLLAAGAAALTTVVLSPNHGVEEANAIEVAPAQAASADVRGADTGNAGASRGGLFSWFGGGDSNAQRRAPEATSAEGERHVLPGVTAPARTPSRAAAPASSQRSSGDDDDDDDGDDD